MLAQYGNGSKDNCRKKGKEKCRHRAFSQYNLIDEKKPDK